MPRFQNSTQKYDQYGNKIPKGRDGLKKHLESFPDAIAFDSKSEYLTYVYLLDLIEKKEIQNLQIKKCFPLVEKRKWWNNFKKKWDIVRELVYISDFSFERDGNNVVLDCKGWKEVIDKKTGKTKCTVYYDEIYKIKKKLFLDKYSDYIFEEL
jgi:Protein of unknown function (DUF1064)